MCVKEEAIRDYLAGLEKKEMIDIYHPSVTVNNIVKGKRSTYGQTTAALRHAKKVVKELMHYTSIGESHVLKKLLNALSEIPDIDPDQAKDLTRLRENLKALGNIGDFSQKQLDVIEQGEVWINFGQCTASDETVIKKMVFAMAFLLKALEFDLVKDINKPFSKFGKVLLTVTQRQAHLEKVREFIKLLDNKPLKASQKPKHNEQARLLRHKVHDFSGIDPNERETLKKQIEELHRALREQKNEILSEKNEFIKSSQRQLESVKRHKERVAKLGMEGFWSSFESEESFCQFLDDFVSPKEHQAWLRNFSLQRDLQWLHKHKNKSWDSYFFWKTIQAVDGFFSYMIWGMSVSKNKILKELSTSEITVRMLNEKLDEKIDEIIDEYTQLAPGESFEGDASNFLNSYHDKRIQEVNRVRALTDRLNESLERKEVSKTLIYYINKTSWWLWLLSSEYRMVTNTVLNVLHEDKNPNVEKLKLIFNLLARSSQSKGIFSLAKLRLEKMMFASLDLFSDRQFRVILPSLEGTKEPSALNLFEKRLGFFADQGIQHKHSSALQNSPSMVYS